MYLIADRQIEALAARPEDVRARIDNDPAGPIGRRVERNLDLDAAPRAEDLDALVRHHLRRARASGRAGP